MAHPYPGSFPFAELQVLLPLLRGQGPTDLSTAIHAAWVFVGFGLGQAVPVQASVASPLTPGQVADLLEQAGSVPAGAEAQIAIPWDLIVPLVIDLFREWVRKRSGQ